jgi:hypothetical protein
MAKMTKSQLTTRKRQVELERLMAFYGAEGEEVLRPSGTSITFPSTDEEGNELYVLVSISIPRGSRLDGEEYDGHHAAQEYERHLEEVAANKRIKEKEREVEAAKRKAKMEDAKRKKEAAEAKQEKTFAKVKEIDGE